MSEVRPRRARGDRDGQPLPADVDEAPGGEFLFRRGFLLTAEDVLDARQGLRGFLAERSGGRATRELGDGFLEFPVDDVLGTVAEAERRFGGPGAVHPDYAFFGTQTIKGGPWDEVEPADAPADWLAAELVGAGLIVGVLDTGLAYDPDPHPWLASRVSADETVDRDLPTEAAGAGYLAEQGGHGTFVAGVLSRVAPAAHLAISRVLKADGHGFVSTVLDGITAVRRIAADRGGRLDILNLSLGGYTREDRSPFVLHSRLRTLVAEGTVVVAAAGNNGTARPFWPAAMPEVIGVGALDGWKPAVFTNYGPWVDACAPGVDVLSTFFDERSGELPDVDLPPGPQGGPLAVTFPGYGRWSGTSFAAPKVAGAIAAAASAWQVDAAAAADRLIRDWRLYRVPDLGVVVNVS